MQRRKWDAKTKALIVLEGLKGKSVAEICTGHQISQSRYYQRRDQFLANAAQAFEAHQHTRTEARLTQENTRLKPLVGELTLELKKKRRAIRMTRRRSLHVTQRDHERLPRLQSLKAEHPFWGYRRVWAFLRFVEHLPVNRKRVWRLMREHHLLVPPNLRLKAKRTPMGSTPQPTKPDAWWGIDMTKVLGQGFGWVSSVVSLDWYTKKIVGSYAGLQAAARHWLAALDMAVNRQFPEGAEGKAVALMSDHGCQPTSAAFMKACRTLGIHQAFTSDNNPKGHADTERAIRTLKEECLWLRDGTCPLELTQAFEAWVADYNEPYLHSTLGYKPPAQFERDYYRSHGPPFLAA